MNTTPNSTATSNTTANTIPTGTTSTLICAPGANLSAASLAVCDFALPTCCFYIDRASAGFV